MGRNIRFRLANVPQLLHQRGHNRLPCFLDGHDYQLFSALLYESAEQFDCKVLALLQLPDAYWAVLTPNEGDGLQRTIQRTGRLYVRHVNGKYRREGTLWAGRYSACPVQPSNSCLGDVARYLEDLPLRRGVTAPGFQWPWYSNDLPGASEAADAKRIEKTLRAGLVYGSSEFCDAIARQSGLPTESRQRGRPCNPSPAV
jgi:putative transposase